MPPTANPQQVHNITTSRTTLRQDIQQAVQQIHNKSNKWSLSFSKLPVYSCLTPAKTQPLT